MQLLHYLIAGGALILVIIASVTWWLNRKINGAQEELVGVVSKKFEDYDSVIGHHDRFIREMAGGGSSPPPPSHKPRSKPLKKQKKNDVDDLDDIIEEERSRIQEVNDDGECIDDECSVQLKPSHNKKKNVESRE